ncbi:pseudouridine synthase [Helicobacter trogontum]|uniref:RNA pseudouridylate synthase n=1 Tax=Helicobacter trogontum TaxID=50960 RepID=A0A4U8TG40_9HELI|nr:pseudouridine synthase [Helicobacter trogontum]MDY5184888.1 pseudouridine synthase [Helicobacter trogontum]TLD99101.1 hypothetical protein LS80_002510 [Helicobacter trogontum]
MGFKRTYHHVIECIKATHFLLQYGYSKKETQKLLDKRRVRQGSKIIQKKDFLEKGIIEVLSFIPDNISLTPFFACVPPNHAIVQQDIANMRIKISQLPPYFCLFNKPSKLLTHPKNLLNSASILDSLRYYFGVDSNPCHRLDYETSGLLLCSIDKKSESILKNLFSERGVQKSYTAILHGEITTPLLIESEIIFPKDFGNLCIQGKASNIKVKAIDCNKIKSITEEFVQNEQQGATSILVPLRVLSDFNEVLGYLYKSKNPFFPSQIQENLVDIVNDFKQGFRQDIDFTLHYKDFYNEKRLLQQYQNFLSYIRNYSDWTANFRIQSENNVESMNHYPSHNEVSKDAIFRRFAIAQHKAFLECNKTLECETNHLLLSKAKSNAKFTLVRLISLSGKTHQLRIHTSSLQHKILGDTLYGLCPIVASLFLDLQSKKLKATIESYLFETITKMHSSNIKGYIYATHVLQRDKTIVQKLLHSIASFVDTHRTFSATLKKSDSKYCESELQTRKKLDFTHSIPTCQTSAQMSKSLSSIPLSMSVECEIEGKKDSIQAAFISYQSMENIQVIFPSYKFLSLSLSQNIIPCFFSSCTCNSGESKYPYQTIHKSYTCKQSSEVVCNDEFKSSFFTFLIFYYALPTHQQKIFKDIRASYCGVDRLLLHASSLKFLGEEFVCDEC